MTTLNHSLQTRLRRRWQQLRDQQRIRTQRYNHVLQPRNRRV